MNNNKHTELSETTPAETKITIKPEKDYKNSSSKYIIFQESIPEYETIMYFLKLQGNEENISYLKKQLDEVDWWMDDDLSVFEMETEHPVSELTAKEMTEPDLNSTSFHRKFDGKLKKIDFKFKPNHSDKRKMKKIFNKLGGGLIDNYISDED